MQGSFHLCNMLLKYYSVFILCFSVVNGEHGEQKCFSRFDYDEKMLMKLLRFEDKVQKFEDFINGVKAREAKEKEERDKLFAAELEKVKNFHERQKNVTSEMLESVAIQFEKNHEQINERMKGKVVAFTVTSPKAGATSSSLTFTTVITNVGNGFDTSTGIFTCPVSGLYYFSLHIVRKPSSSYSYAGCFIYLNGSSKVRAYIEANGAENGIYGASTSVYLNLNVGDVLTIESCNSPISSRVESWTSFSGHLEKHV